MEEREGGQSERDIILNIWEIGRGRAQFAGDGCSCCDVCSWLWCVLRLGFANKITDFTRRGESRMSVMLVSENCEYDLAA